ncbi:MAG: hypothetical protein K2M30_02100 [Desulfovibrionaceae bacterium]|nr:hypothetical protein [Desulfovibrionaceae bacterium]
MSISRRGFLQLLLVNSAVLSIPDVLFSSEAQEMYPRGFYEKPFTISMNLPQVDGYLGYIDATSQYTIDVMPVSELASMTSTMGAQFTWFTKDKKGQYFSPLLEVKRGGVMRLLFPNTILKEPIVPYITGLIFQENSIEYMYSANANRSAYRVQCSVQNPASTCIYHSMREGNSGFYNHQGLSGLLYVHDDIEKMLNARYKIESGVTDIPILLQDRRLNTKGECIYELSRNDELGGYLGNTLLVNGGVYPQLEVANRIYKFRIVNNSNARMLYLGFRTEKEPIAHYIISTGKGYLEKMVKSTQFFLAPFERVEVILDLRAMKGKRISLVNYPFPSMRATKGYIRNTYTDIEQKGCYCMELNCSLDYKEELPSLSLLTGEKSSSLPSTKIKRDFIITNISDKQGVKWRLETKSTVPRELLLEGGHVEEWEFMNPVESIPQCIYIPYFNVEMVRRVDSPSHIRLLALNQEGLIATDFGIKDTITIWPGERVTVKVAIPKTEGREIVVTIHSKILESFDKGMLLLTRAL